MQLSWSRICLQCRRPGFDSWVGKIPWRRKWQPTPVFLPGVSHGQRSLAGYSPWGCKSHDLMTTPPPPRRDRKAFCLLLILPCEDTVRKSALTRTDHAVALILDFQSPEVWGISICCVSPHLCYFVIAA